MVKSTHFGSNRSFVLNRAILLYSDGHELFATLHEPKDSPDGGPPYLDAGEPLTIDFLKELIRGLGKTVGREILPANLLVRTPETLVWWRRRQPRVMFYSDACDGRSLSGRSFPQPTLVFKVTGSDLFVRALAENKRPKAGTPLMFAPYWNCDGHGRVCQGSMQSPAKVCVEAINEWEAAFLGSEFTHAAIGAHITTHPEGFQGLWRDVAGREEDFPSDLLVPSDDSLQDFIDAGEP
jgi:PRTRC genetic system protein B